MSKQILSYDPNLKELAKQLRKNSTLSEVLLWQQLKGKQMKGYDFIAKNQFNVILLIFSAMN